MATLGALAALGVLAGASWSATGSSSSHHGEYGTKVTICHHTHSKKHPFVTITVGPKAAAKHLKHGDTLGACPTTTTTGTTTTGTTTTTKKGDKDDDGDNDDNGTTTSTTSTTSHGHGDGHSEGRDK